MGGGRTLRQNVQHILRVFHSASRRQLVSEHDLLSSVVDLRAKDKSAALLRRLDRPTGERARDVDHVLLGVSAVDAERVQLQQLASVMLVQALTLTLPLLVLLLSP